MDIQDNIFIALSEKGKRITFEVEPSKWFHKTLVKLKLKKNPTITLKLKPLNMGTRFRCMDYITGIPNVMYMDKNIPLPEIDEIVSQKSDNIIKAVACMIHNKPSEIPQRIIKIVQLMDIDTFNVIVQYLKESLETQSFLNSIIYIKGMSLQTKEIIAFDKESQERTK